MKGHDMSTTPVTREYLETIYNLTVEGDPVVGVRLAEKFGVSAPNVAQTLERMQKDGLINMPGRGRGRSGAGIELTEQGKAEAEALLRQHRLAERFLVDVLGMNWVQAHEEAHNMERGMSPEIEAHLMQLLNNPRTCPHGNPIPMGNFNTLEYLREQHAVRLNTVPEGKLMKVLLISEVVEDETAVLTQLGQMDLMPGAKVLVLSNNQQDHVLSAQVTPRSGSAQDDRTVTLPEDLAAKIWVRD
jgi:DtxR family transcriptional regulator, Mn-dependent transcriptional regulator